jgi:hypothetical protein
VNPSLRHALLVLLLAWSGWARAAQPAATVILLTGRGTATALDGSIRALVKDEPVYSGEVVSSGANSYLDLKFSDGGFFLLRPNSRFELRDYVDHTGGAAPAAPSPAPVPAQSPPPSTPAAQASTTDSRAFFRLLKGGFRTLSGLIGKINHDEYQVATPVATIGIRGTDYLAVICDETCATDPVLAEVLPPGVSAVGGLVTTVYAHSIVVNTAKGSLVLEVGQYLLVLPDGTSILLPEEPHFLHVDPIPNPANCAA